MASNAETNSTPAAQTSDRLLGTATPIAVTDRLSFGASVPQKRKPRKRRALIAALIALSLLALPATAMQRPQLNSNVAHVQLTLFVPESAGMTATMGTDGKAQVEISWNLLKAPSRLAVEYDDTVYEALCPNNEPCSPRNSNGAVLAMGTTTITIPVRVRAGEIQEFKLVIEEA